MLKKLIGKVRDQDEPQIPRAAIYLRGLEDETAKRINVPSTHYQRAACQYAAKALHANVVGEFNDVAGAPLQPDLERLMTLIEEEPRLDYLIVYALDRLTHGRDRAFALGWCLGSAGVTLVNADTDDVRPWTSGSRPK